MCVCIWQIKRGNKSDNAARALRHFKHKPIDIFIFNPPDAKCTVECNRALNILYGKHVSVALSPSSFGWRESKSTKMKWNAMYIVHVMPIFELPKCWFSVLIRLCYRYRYFVQRILQKQLYDDDDDSDNDGDHNRGLILNSKSNDWKIELIWPMAILT